MNEPIAYRLHWQDFSGRKIGIGAPLPPKCHTDHATREDAEKARAALVLNPDVACTITPRFAKRRNLTASPAEWVAAPPVARRPGA
jgi:hypothetical protein